MKRGIPPGRVRQLVSACGVTFIADASDQKRLRALGFGDDFLRLVAPPASASAGTRWRASTDGREMIRVVGGSFVMGTPPAENQRDADEGPHRVTVDSFWLDATEVSKEAFRRFLEASPEWRKDRIESRFHDGGYLRDWADLAYPQGEGELPVVNVSWHAARAYAAWAGKRLPTEAEWEYAARAGTATPYWWGTDFDPHKANSGPSPARVSDPATANPWGFMHILGNVWEWTSTAYAPYPYAADARETQDGTAPRVRRGGAWNSAAAFLRAGNRVSSRPTTTNDQTGFRCAR